MNKIKAKVGIVWKSTEPKYAYLTQKLKELDVSFKSLDSELIENETSDSEVDILYIHPKDAKFIPKYFELFPNLKWVQGQFAGVDTFIPFKEYFDKRNIPLTNAKGAFSPSLGEFVPAYLLYWDKKLGVFKDLNKQKKWEYAPVQMLEGKTITIVGYGNIGVEVAKRLKLGFNMRIIGVKNSLSHDTPGKELVDELVDRSKIEYAVSQADFVCSILPKTKETDGIFNDQLFSHFKKGSVFINIGRGTSVNEDDLIKHLKSQTNLKGACLDVTCIEPLPQTSELWDLENCYITNHSADWLDDGLNNQKLTMDLFIRLIREEYLVDGKPKSNIINLDLGY